MTGAPVGDEPADVRVRRLEDAAESLADRLAQVSPTASSHQLGDLIERYAAVTEELQEAQRAWTVEVRSAARASSGSPGQSAAASQP